jgi:hypothetical protein
MDKTTKVLLAIAAAGLWANVAVGVLKPAGAIAQNYEVGAIASDLSKIQRGTCVNKKICGTD